MHNKTVQQNAKYKNKQRTENASMMMLKTYGCNVSVGKKKKKLRKYSCTPTIY